MSSSLSIIERRSAAGLLLTLDGVIDETLDTQRLRHLLEAPIIAIDLDAVRRVSSPGVREWKNAFTGAPATFIGLMRCRPGIVNQLNWVQGFSGAATLISLYLPYLCESCQGEFELLIDLRREHAIIAAFEPPPAVCPSCGGGGVFDALPPSYLHFAASQPRPAPPPSFDAAAQATPPSSTRPSLKLRKVVEGGWTGFALEGALDDFDYFKRAEEGLEGPVLFSLSGVERIEPGGARRLLEFLHRVNAPLWLDGAPLELLDHWAAFRLPPSLKLFRTRATFRCTLHGATSLNLEWASLTNPELECETCGQLLSAGFSVERLARYPFSSARLSPELEPLLAALHPARPRLRLGDIGSVVMNRYLVLRQLGVGGMAEVLLAKSRAPGGFEKLLVVKRALPHLRADQAFVELFLTEARLAGRLNHPNVVQIFDVARDGDEYFIIMEYVNGVDLSSLLRRAAQFGLPCPLGVALRIGASIASALHAAHEHLDDAGVRRPIVHHDVSPHNVLVGFDGQVKLTDFGVAQLSTSPQASGVLRGKVAYQAPEALRGSGQQPSVDVFAAGVVLYQLLTYQHPFARSTEAETLGAILAGPIAPVGSVREVPPAVSALVAELLERDPHRRTGPAGRVAGRLETVIAEHRLAASAEDVAHWVNAVFECAEAQEGASNT